MAFNDQSMTVSIAVDATEAEARLDALITAGAAAVEAMRVYDLISSQAVGRNVAALMAHAATLAGCEQDA